MRLYDPKVYDRWVKHEIKFDSPEILKAFEIFDRLIRTPKMVYGGTKKILNTFVEDAPLPMFADPPQCLMHRQAMLISAQFPDSSKFGDDGNVNVFPLPPMSNRKQSVMLTGGDLAAAFNDRPEVIKVMEYLISPEFGKAMIQNNNALSPNKLIGFDSYRSLLNRTVARLWRGAEIVRVDASDMMPGVVGTGTFWTGAIDFINGKSAKQVARQIDASWPSTNKE